MKLPAPPTSDSSKQASSVFPKRSFPVTWLLGVTILYVGLRIPHLGHLLVWDEAWILCALKSFTGNGSKLFESQLWRHPPVFMGLGLLLSPLEQGFDFRMQSLSLIINTISLLIFLPFTAKFMGRRIALFSGIAYSLLPGAVFYSTWIKRDSLVILFGLLAFWAFFERKHLLAGIFLGIGFLSKETALFFALGLTIFIVVSTPRNKILYTLAMVLLPSVFLSGWWYILYSTSSKNYLAFFQGSSGEASLFAYSSWYYFSQLKYDIGWAGLGLLVIGLLALLPKFIQKTSNAGLRQYLKKSRLLPFYILIPGYFILTLSHGKPPWMTIIFYPFLALLIGLGWQLVIKTLVNFLEKSIGKTLKQMDFSAALLLIVLLGLPLKNFKYMNYGK